MLLRIDTCPSPPVMCPTSESAKSTRRFAIPPRFMTSPTNMKNGMASSGKLFIPEMISAGSTMKGRSMTKSITRLATPRLKTIGTPISVKPKSTERKIQSISRSPPFLPPEDPAGRAPKDARKS